MMKTKIPLPKLRFQEFKTSILFKFLSNISNITKGDQINKTELTLTGKYYCLNGGLKLSGWTNKFNRLANTISISEGGESCGFVNYNTEDFWSGGHLYTLDNLDKDIHPYFLFSFLKSMEKSIMRLRVGSGLPNLQKPSISKIKIFYPSIIEQTKIAQFFNLLDKQIDLIDRKIELYELRKKYYLNNILKFLETNGKKVLLKDLFIEKNILPITSLEGFNPISIKLHGKGFKKSNLIVKLSKGGRKYYERFPGDVVIGLQNFHNGSIGILPDYFIKPIMSNAIISFDVKKVNKILMVEYFLSSKFLFYLNNISEGTGQKEFSKKNILNITYFIINQDMEELFSNFLSLNIKTIEHLNIKKEKMIKRKTYYLNNMFI